MGTQQPFQGEKDFKTEWEFKCPVVASLLQQTEDPTVDFCKVCNKNVYLVSTRQELHEHVEQGHCVAFDAKDDDGHLVQANKQRLNAIEQENQQNGQPRVR